jgi:hypothetical protein
LVTYPGCGHIFIAGLARESQFGNHFLNPMAFPMQTIHSLNILVHVLSGTAALLLGLIALLARKASAAHIRFGRYFLRALMVVISTALIGSIFFRTNPFLLMLTLTSGYAGFSGYRIIRFRGNPLPPVDGWIALIVLLTAGIYSVILSRTSADWSPVVVYSTLASLGIMTGYDLIKRLWLFNRLRTWWLYEHIYKMLAAFTAILSAFTGTVLPDYKPYSQIGPSVIWFVLVVYFIGRQNTGRVKRPAGVSGHLIQ